MRIYNFPFTKIKKDSKIIIYGGGGVGKSYVAQCKAQNYADILFVLDADLLWGSSMHECDTKAIYEFRAEAETIDYDYIIIAVSNPQTAETMKRILLDMGVPKEKIVCELSYYDSVKHVYEPELRQFYQPTFSCYGEDLIVLGIFKMINIKHPTYLDIGCNHPYSGNNTALFYLTGSVGVNVDANQHCIDMMNKERKDDCNLCMGITPHGGTNTFYMVDEISGLNSFSLDNINEHFESIGLKKEEIKNTIQIECYNIDEVIEKYCNGVFPDFFDIDIEGLDAEVVKSYDFTKNGPTVMCIEAKDAEMNEHLYACGYIKYFETPANVIFIKKEIADRILNSKICIPYPD